MNEPTRHRQESKRVAVKHSQQKNPLTSILSNNSQILNRYEVEEMECARSEKNHTVVVCAPKIVCAPLIDLDLQLRSTAAVVGWCVFVFSVRVFTNKNSSKNSKDLPITPILKRTVPLRKISSFFFFLRVRPP